MILVSACLLGLDTRYDGISNDNDLLRQYSKYGKFVPVCPEQLGGLPTPRRPVEICGGTGEDVLAGYAEAVTDDGADVTAQFIKGAREVLKIVRLYSVKVAILKERSPSCGSKQIYDGSFTRKCKDGQGVTAALLRQNGLSVYSEQEVTKELLEQWLELHIEVQ